MMEGDGIEEMRAELTNYNKCVAGNPTRFNALTTVKVYDGHDLDGDCCKPIDKNVMGEITQEIMRKIVFGKMKVDGKMGQWSCGFMGSRWFDYEDDRLTHCRVAFHSKKFHKTQWKQATPYGIVITMEVAN